MNLIAAPAYTCLDDGDFYRIGRRVGEWGLVVNPNVFSAFWSAETGENRCVCCRRLSFDLAYASVILPEGHDRSGEVAKRGLPALLDAPADPGELWFASCSRCPIPATDQEREAIARLANHHGAAVVCAEKSN